MHLLRSTQHSKTVKTQNCLCALLLVRSLYNSFWAARVAVAISGRAVRESKRKKQELKRNYTQSHFQRNFFKRRQARKKQCTYLSEAFAKQKTHKQHAHTKNQAN